MEGPGQDRTASGSPSGKQDGSKQCIVGHYIFHTARDVFNRHADNRIRMRRRAPNGRRVGGQVTRKRRKKMTFSIGELLIYSLALSISPSLALSNSLSLCEPFVVVLPQMCFFISIFFPVELLLPVYCLFLCLTVSEPYPTRIGHETILKNALHTAAMRSVLISVSVATPFFLASMKRFWKMVKLFLTSV